MLKLIDYFYILVQAARRLKRDSVSVNEYYYAREAVAKELRNYNIMETKKLEASTRKGKVKIIPITCMILTKSVLRKTEAFGRAPAYYVF